MVSCVCYDNKVSSSYALPVRNRRELHHSGLRMMAYARQAGLYGTNIRRSRRRHCPSWIKRLLRRCRLEIIPVYQIRLKIKRQIPVPKRAFAMTFTHIMRGIISIYALLTGCIVQKVCECFFGKEFLFGTFSLNETENQSFIILNPSEDKIATVNITRQGVSTVEHVLQKESFYVNGLASNDSILVRSNEYVSLQGLFGNNNIHYTILPISSLGTNYILVYGVNFNASETICSITALRNQTSIEIKMSDKGTFPNSTSFPSDYIQTMTHMENIQIQNLQGLYNVSITASALISVVCGEKDRVNNIRVHLPPIDLCIMTSYDVPCFDISKVPPGEVHVRIIKIYPLYQDATDIYIDGSRDNKTNQEKSMNKSFRITANNPFCVRSHIRKWKYGALTFYNDDFQISIKVENSTTSCFQSPQDLNDTLSENNNTKKCMCPCKAKPEWHNLTDVEFSRWLRGYIVATRKELVLGKKELTSSKRQKISAPDPRISAKSIGVVGVVIICGLVCTLISFDCPRFLKSVKLLKEKYLTNRLAKDRDI
ncbi:uncharacterized protein LOC133183981 [Saccostrea echinata]|uniref:uncharacterized protein LOC133183981 n=1 Tax=Saccostrea echinata TaxID=191078 RepID=UPI002A8066A8|nr:uncharacterized protein LOC133183981 [Saccostrea echinata]